MAFVDEKNVHPYCLGLYEKSMPSELDWEERLRLTRELGFDYMEFSVDESDQRQARLGWTTQERLALVRTMEQTGVRLESMCLSGHRKWPFGSHDAGVREHSLEIMRDALELARNLGLHTIQLAGYDVYYEEGDEQTAAWFYENLCRATEMAAQAGVMLGFETMETPFMDTVQKAMHYVKRVNSPYLGVYPDTGNLTNASFLYGVSVADDIAHGAGHIVAAHIKETVAGAYREIPFSTGTTDYEGALSQLVAQGVCRYVAEMWYTGSKQWQDDIAFAAEFARNKLDAAFVRYTTSGSDLTDSDSSVNSALDARSC